MRYVKKVGIILVLLLIVGFCVENIMLHPFRGSAFDILNISEEQIIEVRINHYGETVSITEPEQVRTIVSMFQCQLERRGTDYIGHSNGVDWYLVFVSNEGSEKGFIFYPRNGAASLDGSQIKIGHYYYACDTVVDANFIRACWEAASAQS